MRRRMPHSLCASIKQPRQHEQRHMLEAMPETLVSMLYSTHKPLGIRAGYAWPRF